MTKQRKCVKEALCQAGRTHPTAEAVYFLAKALMPSIAMGTVYRNLSQMCDEGEVRKIKITNAPDRFDMDMKKHDHLVCVKCGNLTDVECGGVYIPPVNIPCGVKLLETEIMLKCICENCNK